jgi:hypothetical protein
MDRNESPLRFYRVRVGHFEVLIEAASTDEAIQLARRHFARELPRLYDVIRSLTATRFQVENAA